MKRTAQAKMQTKSASGRLKIAWGGHNKTDYAGISCLEGCGIQAFYTDFNKFVDENNKLKPLAMSMLCKISLSDNNCFYCLESNEDNTNSTVRKALLPFGSAIFFSANYSHAGQEYFGENLRAHRYIESHNMIHGETVSQDSRVMLDTQLPSMISCYFIVNIQEIRQNRIQRHSNIFNFNQSSTFEKQKFGKYSQCGLFKYGDYCR